MTDISKRLKIVQDKRDKIKGRLYSIKCSLRSCTKGYGDDLSRMQQMHRTKELELAKEMELEVKAELANLRDLRREELATQIENQETKNISQTKHTDLWMPKNW